MMKEDFRRGLMHGIPIGVGYLSVAFAFGIFAVANGLTAWEATFVSMAVFTSAGQLAAVPIIGAGGGLVELVISQVVINLRYCLMSISLSQKLDDTVTGVSRWLCAFFNSDEIFAVASAQPGRVGKWYLYGLGIVSWLGWGSGTLIGALAGNILPAVVTEALGVAIYGMFIAIVLPVAREDRAVGGCVAIAVTFSCVFAFVPALQAVPSGFTMILCAAVASAVMAIVAPVQEVEA